MLFYGLAVILSVIAVLFGGMILVSPMNYTYSLETGLPFTLLSFTIDSLSAFFIVLIGLISLAVSIYSIGYVKEYKGKKSISYLAGMYSLFFLLMIGVVSADNVFTFLFMWESMSLVSYFLVIYQHEKQEVRNAGFIYIVMTHIGAIFIFVAFFILAYMADGISFTQLKENGIMLSDGIKSIVFILAVIGFGSKSGIVPFHIWLPKAHPAAPGPISAIMSAVMIKTGIYGLLRILFDFTGQPLAWWGVLLLVIGAVTALFGILKAIVESDLKRLLAYSSAENIGVIYLGMGASTLLLAYNQPLIASFALLAALVHLMNHSFFKGLLFMGTGAVMQATGTKNMENLGGLIKKMPWTSAFFLIGSIAISALPPLNGFIGEWLTLQSLLLVMQNVPVMGVQIIIPLIAAALVLTSALVVMTFVKAFGITFLAKPRSSAAEQAKEVSFSMRAGMFILALGCIFLGIGAPFVIQLLSPAVSALISPVYQLETNWFIPTASLTGEQVQLSLAILLLVLLILAFVSILFIRLISRKTKRQKVNTWGCGISLEPQMTYSGVSLVQPIQRSFDWFYRSRGKWGEAQQDNIEQLFYRPIKEWVVILSGHIRKVQNGSIQLYLGFMLCTLLLLLILQVSR